MVLRAVERRERPCGAIGTHWDPLGHATLTVTLSESEVSWGEVSEEDISPLTR